MDIEKEVDKFINNIKLIEEYTEEIKNNSKLLKKVTTETIELSKIKDALNDTILKFNNLHEKNTNSIKNYFYKTEEIEITIQQHLISLLNKYQLQNKEIAKLNLQLIFLKKLSKITLIMLSFTMLLVILSLFI